MPSNLGMVRFWQIADIHTPKHSAFVWEIGYLSSVAHQCMLATRIFSPSLRLLPMTEIMRVSSVEFQLHGFKSEALTQHCPIRLVVLRKVVTKRGHRCGDASNKCITSSY